MWCTNSVVNEQTHHNMWFITTLALIIYVLKFLHDVQNLWLLMDSADIVHRDLKLENILLSAGVNDLDDKFNIKVSRADKVGTQVYLYSLVRPRTVNS